MRLLIITQKVDTDDAILGFFHRWIKEFAEYYDGLIIICLEKGRYNLPSHVSVHSLGKEDGATKLQYILNFYTYVWRERKNYDNVFVHMNPEYIVLAGWLWKILNKNIFLWYTHKQVSWQLRVAEIFAKKIFTASEKSFRLPSDKVKVMGHGIDVEKFVPSQTKPVRRTLLTVGRISETKQIKEIIEIFEKMRISIKDLQLMIVGSPIYKKDQIYFERVKEYIAEKGLGENIHFLGSVPNQELPRYYQQASLFVNLSKTGSLDKAVLEAMSCDVPVVTTNEAFRGIVPSGCFVASLDEVPAKALKVIGMTSDLRSQVIHTHSLSTLIQKLMNEINAD